MSLATRTAGRRRVRGWPLALALGGLGALALVVAALGLVAAGPGSGERAGAAGAAAGPLGWTAPPKIYVAPGKPTDRILSGVIRNDSLEVAEVRAADLEVFDASGSRLVSGSIFLGSFGRGLYARPRRDQASDIEQRRTGRLLRIGPGATQPLTVSWRLGANDARAERIEYPGGSLRIP